MAKQKPVRLIVRRGATHRFEALERKTANLPVEVTWDRRSSDRRAASGSVPVERRSNDRRKAPPFTWEAADFVVVCDAEESGATSAPATAPTEVETTSKAVERRQKVAVTAKVKVRKARAR